ncbi:ABC transporter substrate-binding protein [Microbacterium sp. gxy059]|uniref:ABC transporter substrate-binding protein n=1 Tax=Microbacterium sp. gxy059 TaxID=2957199 RepID=UPI003D962E65
MNMKRGTRRGVAVTAAAGLASIALTACLPSDDSAEGSGEGAEKLVLAQSSDFKPLDPHNSAETPAERVFANVYSRLFSLDEAMDPVPELVTDYEQPDDETWVFQIRDDVVFSDGEPLDAEDVAFSLNRVSSDETTLEYPFWNRVQEATATDDYTVEVTTDGAMPAMLRLLAKSGGDILPADLIDDIGIDEFLKAPIGSGPYKIDTWQRDDRVLLSPNEEYYGDAPKWDEVEYRVIPEASTRVSELLTGGVDIITDVPPVDWDRMDAEDGADVLFGETTRVMMMVFRNDEPWITSDKRVREAVDLAIDNEAITEGLFDGRAMPIRSRVPVGIFGANPDLQDTFVYDPDRAKELIAEVEEENGEPVTLNIMAPRDRYPLDADMTEMVVGMLEEAGIQVETEILDGVTFSEKWGNKEQKEAAIIGLADGLFDASYSMTHYLMGNSQNEGRAAYHSEEVSSLINDADSNMDQDRREELYQEALAIVAEDRPHVFLLQQMSAYGVSDRVTFEPRLDDRTYFDDITLD